MSKINTTQNNQIYANSNIDQNIEPAFQKGLLNLETDEAIKFLIKQWELSEKCKGALLYCKDSIVEKVNQIGLAYFLTMATGIIYEPNEKTIWLKILFVSLILE